MFRRHLTLAEKGLLLLAIPFIYQVLLLTVLLRQQNVTREARSWAEHSKDVLYQIEFVELQLISMQNDLRGYIISGNTSFRDASSVDEQKLNQAVLELKELVVDNPSQLARWNTMRQAIARRLEWNHHKRDLIESGRRDEAVQMVSTEGQQLVNAVLDEAQALRLEEETLEHQRSLALARSLRLQNLGFAAGLMLSVILALVTGLVFARSITRRLRDLAENVARFGRGEALLPTGPGTDELASLDRAFHTMAADLAVAHQKEREAALQLERRNEELSRANHDLRQKNQENEMFVYSVSHDLRSPLVNLLGFSKELNLSRTDLGAILQRPMADAERQRAQQLLDRDMAESIRFIQTAVTRLSAIIDSLLRLSRAGRVEYRPQVVELQPVIQRIVEAMRATITEKGAEVTIRPLPSIWGDSTAIDQIFANLVGNAVNYLDPQRPGKIEIGFREEPHPAAEGFQVIYVRDNGLGIAEDYLPKVFAIFQRLHAAYAPGEGIGLALVRRMVERHGGRIWVESQPGVGSTFFVALPERPDSPLVIAPKKESPRITVASDPK